MLEHLRSMVVVLALSACGGGDDPASVKGVAALPADVDMPVGFNHDVLLAGCERSASLAALLGPLVITTAFSVEAGRLDVLLAVPGATLDAVLEGPQLGDCVPVDFEVGDVTLSLPDWQLEPTDNAYAFRVHAASAGEAVLEAHVDVDGEPLVARSTLRAHEITSITFDPLCDVAYEERPANVWIPAGGTVAFWQVIWHDDIQLVGYGASVVDLGDRFTVDGFQPAAITADGIPTWNVAIVNATVASQTGPLTLTSQFDAAYEQQLTVYDEAMIDGLRAERLTVLLAEQATDVVAPGANVEVLILPTIAGEDVCRAEARRQATIETPEVCAWIDASDATMELTAESRSRPWLKALAPGTCRIRATIPTTGVSTTLELDVITQSCDSLPEGCACYDDNSCVYACGDFDSDGRYSMNDWSSACSNDPTGTIECCVLQQRDFDRDGDFDRSDCDAWLDWWENGGGSQNGVPDCAQSS